MIKTNTNNAFDYRKVIFRSDILIFFFCFLLGVIIGTACIKINGTEGCLIKRLSAAETWFGYFLNNVKYIVPVFFLAFTAFGRAVIPFIYIIHGYCLSGMASYAIASSGISGFFSFMIRYGTNSAILLPILLFFSTLAIDVSTMIFGFLFIKNKTIRMSQRKSIEFIILFFVSVLLLLLLSFLEAGIASMFVKTVSNPL